MNVPPELLDDIVRRRAVLYIGAGVSSSASTGDGKRPPNWKEFLNEGIVRLGGLPPTGTVKRLIKTNDLLTACEVLKDALDESWPTLLKEKYLQPRYTPSNLHRALHNLDLPIVLTPNFDYIYDNFAKSETGGSTVVKNYWDSDVPLTLRRENRAVLKVHGTIEEPSRMVFSRGDYARLRAEYRQFSEIIGALFVTNTFFFVGTSLNDPDLRLFLESYHYSHPNSPPHYMTSPTGEIHKDEDASIRRNMNLKLIRYSNRNGHAELVEMIRKIGEDAEAGRALLAVTSV